MSTSDRPGIADSLRERQDELVDRLHGTLMELIYQYRSYLRPSQLRQLAFEQGQVVLEYLETGDKSVVTAFANSNAAQGLGIEGQLRILDSLRSFCEGTTLTCDGVTRNEMINAYVGIHLGAFISTREAIILQEQERIRAAMQRSLSHNNLWLQTAAEISKVATSTLNLPRLLDDSVSIIRKHFLFHHVGLFLLEAENEHAVLRASSGHTNASVLSHTHSVAITKDTLIGQCVLDATAQVVVDVGTREFRTDEIILPETKSIMILPIVSRNLVIGIILIQSTQTAAFGEDDITRLQTVADQLANAIQNARLYHELELYSQGLELAVKARTNELEKTKERVEAILNNSPDAILLLDPNGRVELCNTAFYSMFGYAAPQVAGRSILSFVTPEYTVSLDDLIRVCSEVGESKWFQVIAQRQDETVFDAGGAMAAITKEGNVTALVCSFRDISEQVSVEAQIKASLQEKEVLLREIHHRVKNNMQVISSLLALQAGYTDDVDANQMFRESQNRIRSMALVHELLYQSKDLAKIDFVEYVHKLTRHLLHSYLIDSKRIELDIISGPVYLEIDTAIPCGLIINELISNSLKHAFPDNRQGTLRVELRTEGNGLHTIIVRDDGVGLPKGLNVHQTETLGLQLVTSLAGQLNATIGLHSFHGTTFEIRFAIPKK
jgi:PAS domain S-box-containing protein